MMVWEQVLAEIRGLRQETRDLNAKVEAHLAECHPANPAADASAEPAAESGPGKPKIPAGATGATT